MQKAKSSPPSSRGASAAKKGTPPEKSQAQRLLEAANKAKLDGGGSGFSRSMGKATLTKNARKTAKGQIGG
jgi:hypothetical protein